MSEKCRQLHNIIHQLPRLSWPFSLNDLPRNGIYFFFEGGESWGHSGKEARIVRVGTHREGNFRSRMSDHFVFNEGRMAFGKDNAAPKDRSIFRKNIGRAILHREADPYEQIWGIDFTTPRARDEHSWRRDVEKEKQIEREVTRILRERFTFSWIALEGEDQRMGPAGLESAMIGTVASCKECRPSLTWLGRFSPRESIVKSGLWLQQHLQAPALTDEAMIKIAALVPTGRG